MTTHMYSTDCPCETCRYTELALQERPHRVGGWAEKLRGCVVGPGVIFNGELLASNTKTFAPEVVLRASQDAAVACMLLAQEYERHLQELLRLLSDGDYEDALEYARTITAGPAIPLTEVLHG